MKIHFNFTPKAGYNLNDRLSDLVRNEDFAKYLTHMVDTPIRMEMKLDVKKNTKQALYDYYHGPLMAVAIQAYTSAGYEMMDQVKCDYLLKAECARGTMTTPDGEEFYLLDKSRMPKKRLVKFVNDCIVHLEMNLNVPAKNIPDSESYKNLHTLGHAFKSVKYINNK